MLFRSAAIGGRAGGGGLPWRRACPAAGAAGVGWWRWPPPLPLLVFRGRRGGSVEGGCGGACHGPWRGLRSGPDMGRARRWRDCFGQPSAGSGASSMNSALTAVGADSGGTRGSRLPPWRRCREAPFSPIRSSWACRVKAQASVSKRVTTAFSRRFLLGGIALAAVLHPPPSEDVIWWFAAARRTLASCQHHVLVVIICFEHIWPGSCRGRPHGWLRLRYPTCP